LGSLFLFIDASQQNSDNERKHYNFNKYCE